MFKKILVPLENTSTDQVILGQIKQLLQFTKAEIIFVHVADGFAARLQDQLNLQDSEEIKTDSKEETATTANGKVSSLIISENVNSKSILKKDVSNMETQKSIAFSGSLDLRVSRQFEMSMDGNASMSARLIAVPPPEEFKTHIMNTLKH